MLRRGVAWLGSLLQRGGAAPELASQASHLPEAAALPGKLGSKGVAAGGSRAAAAVAPPPVAHLRPQLFNHARVGRHGASPAAAGSLPAAAAAAAEAATAQAAAAAAAEAATAQAAVAAAAEAATAQAAAAAAAEAGALPAAAAADNSQTGSGNGSSSTGVHVTPAALEQAAVPVAKPDAPPPAALHPPTAVELSRSRGVDSGLRDGISQTGALLGIVAGTPPAAAAAASPPAAADGAAADGEVSSSRDGGGIGRLDVSPAAMEQAAALLGKLAGPGPRLAQLALDLGEEWRQAGASEADIHDRLRIPGMLRDMHKERRVTQQLTALFGVAGGQAILAKRAGLKSSPPATITRALAAMALCSVRQPLKLAARAPYLLHSNHTSTPLITSRLALQRYLGLDAAEVYEQYPSYLLPSAFRLCCRLQFLQEQDRLQYLVRNRAEAGRQWRQQAYVAAVAGQQQEQQQQQPEEGDTERQGASGKQQQQQQWVVEPQAGQQQSPGQAAAAAGKAAAGQEEHPMVPAAVAAAAAPVGQQAQQAAAWAGEAGAQGVPTFFGMSLLANSHAEKFCRLSGCDMEALQRFDAGFASHPAWAALQRQAAAEAAQLDGLLRQLEQRQLEQQQMDSQQQEEQQQGWGQQEEQQQEEEQRGPGRHYFTKTARQRKRGRPFTFY